MKRFFKRVLLAVIAVMAVLFVPAILQYVLCPVYEFPPDKSFEGDTWYNPYDGLEVNWYKANFHVHSISWGGLTSGEDSVRHIFTHYRNMGYDIVSISDYHKISGLDCEEWILPAYEHGFNPWKTHQIVLGARGIAWRDYVFGQNKHHKQHILNTLRDDCDFLILAHPAFSEGYDSTDVTVLTGYDAVEVLNHYRTSDMHWDAALSAGRAVWLTGSDDSHNVNKSSETGVRWTMINAVSKSRGEIVEGRCDIRLLDVEVINHRLIVAIEPAAEEIRFIGQGGVLKKTVSHRSFAEIDLKTSDTYMRTEIEGQTCRLYLNPILRYDGDTIPRKSARVKLFATWIQRTVGFGGIGLLLVVIFRFRRNRRKNWKEHT